MRFSPLFFALLLVVALSCGSQPSPDAPVIVVVAPGINYTLVKDYLEKGVLPRDGGFAAIRRDGFLAPLEPIYSPETGPSRASLWTGAPPSVHGIIGNSFRIEGEPLAGGTGTFDTPLLAETVLDAARRAGKRVVRLTDWPPSAMEHAASFEFAPKTLSQPAILQIKRVQGRDTWESASPAEANSKLELTLLDKTRVQIEVQVRGARNRMRFLQGAQRGEWAEFRNSWALVKLPGGAAAAWVKWMETPPGADASSTAKLFTGPVVECSQHALLRGFERTHGPWPGRAQGGMLRTGRIDDQTWWEQSKRLHEYHLQLGLDVLRHNAADLLLMDMSWMDSAGHVLALEHPRQAAYADEGGAKRKRFAGYMQEAYRLLDEAILHVQKAMPRNARLVVVSDHGMMPAHTSIPLQKLIGQLGWEIDPAKDVDARVYESISSAHIYLSPRREGEAARLQEFCRSITDPATGERVFEDVLRGGDLARIGFGGPRAGALWVMAKPGYEISSEADAEWAPASFTGLHGYRGNYPENLGVLGILGAKNGAASAADMSVLDVAATLSDLLGIAAPKQSAGRALLRK